MGNRKGISVGVEITGTAKGYKAAAADAKKATAQLEKEARARSKQIEQSFKQVTIAIAKIGGAVLVAKKAFDIYGKAMNSTEGSADKFEEQMSYLKGTVQGAMTTLFSGDWLSLITNINNAAIATRDLAKAEDELTQAKARNAISKGDLEIQLNAAKLAAAEEPGDTKESKARKKGYLNEAIDFQKEITAINVKELQGRVDATAEYYKKVFAQDEDYWTFVKDNIVTVAKNYDYFFNNLSNFQARVNDLKGMGPLTKEQETERRRLQLTIYLLEDYTKLQSDLSKKGQFEVWLEGMAAVREEVAAGDQEILKLTKQVTTLGTALDKTGKIAENSTLKRLTDAYSGGGKEKGEYAKPTTPFSYAETFGSFRFADEFKSGTDELEQFQNGIQRIQDAFASLFANTDIGFKGMAIAFGNALKQMIADLLAKAVIFGILTLLTGGTGALAGFAGKLLGGKTLAGFMGFAKGGIIPPGYPNDSFPAMLSSGETILPSKESRNFKRNTDITLHGDITGRSIALLGRRTQDEN